MPDTQPQPQHAPGDPVLIAAEVIYECEEDNGDRSTHVRVRTLQSVHLDEPLVVHEQRLYVAPADVHTVPPTPDPRDQAIAAVRAAMGGWLTGADSYDVMRAVRDALDGVVPVPDRDRCRPCHYGHPAECEHPRGDCASRGAAFAPTEKSPR